MGLLCIGMFHYQLFRRVILDRPVELVLHFCKKLFGGFGGGVVAWCGGVDVSDILIEPSLK